MNTNTGLRFLRPYLCADVQVPQRIIYLRFHSSALCRNIVSRNSKKQPTQDRNALSTKSDIRRRLDALRYTGGLDYPRILNDSTFMSICDFREKYHDIKKGETLKDDRQTLRGRILSIRLAGNFLGFIDIAHNGATVQIIVEKRAVSPDFFENNDRIFREFMKRLQHGDILSATGFPSTSTGGELSLSADVYPIVLSPALAMIPHKLEDPATRAKLKHVDMLVNSKVTETLRLRAHIIKYIRDYLTEEKFLEVQTPVLADKAGGATARPFTTRATEFPHKPLALRISPELWLKRLIMGGIDRVFEICTVFRNEGLDATHNPEFTMCEFYKAFADLEDLMSMTETLITGLGKSVNEWRVTSKKVLPEFDAAILEAPYKRLAFIPAIEAAIGEPLPNLEELEVEAKLLVIFEKNNIALPASPTLPKLLDKLASLYIEPQCTSPTFITFHPACMAPLAKSFIDPVSGQHLSARAELFINRKEIANLYEEENSPSAQRKKFMQQNKYKDDENMGGVDENYCQALEYGMPPTGGWGCGVDRLVMLLSGQERIADVLSFGSLRHVVNMGHGGEGQAHVKGDGNKQVKVDPAVRSEHKRDTKEKKEDTESSIVVNSPAETQTTGTIAEGDRKAENSVVTFPEALKATKKDTETSIVVNSPAETQTAGTIAEGDPKVENLVATFPEALKAAKKTLEAAKKALKKLVAEAPARVLEGDGLGETTHRGKPSRLQKKELTPEETKAAMAAKNSNQYRRAKALKAAKKLAEIGASATVPGGDTGSGKGHEERENHH